jgi:hypothetical protein
MISQVSGFQVSIPIYGNWKLFEKTGTKKGNFMETLSLKALANKVLQGNRPGNKMETLSFQGEKLEGESFQIGKPAGTSLPATLDDYQILFKSAVKAVSVQYPPGTLEMVRADFPELAGEMRETEDGINDLWLQAQEGSEDIDAFRETVDRWKSLYRRGIQFYPLS